jgi:hypothetical protein
MTTAERERGGVPDHVAVDRVEAERPTRESGYNWSRYGASRDRTGDLLLAKAVWGSMGGVGRARIADKTRVSVFVGDRWWRSFSASA